MATENDFVRSNEPKITTTTKIKEEINDNGASSEIENETEVENHFMDIPIDFLEDLTEIFDDLSIADSQDALDYDTHILSKKLTSKGRKNELVEYLLRQWRKALLEAIEQKKRIEEEIARKKRSRRPVWKCAVCGRPSNPGCPVSPYIYGYQDIDTGEMFSSILE